MKKKHSDVEAIVFAKMIGMRIRLIRENKKLTQEDLCNRCELSQSALSRAEIGESDLSLYALFKLARALNVPVKSLL
jgi:transcriptional regulator with XRE-family HTH domain